MNERERVVILDRGRPIKITCTKCGARKVLDEFGISTSVSRFPRI
jgi:hypothetical protein